jgi:hypothetical protein
MGYIRSLTRWIGVLLLLSLVAACFTRLQDNGSTGRQGDVQVLSPLAKEVGAPAPPPTASAVVTAMAEPTWPPTPTPSSGEGHELPTPTITPTPAKIMDLAAGVAPTETMVYIVQRADGSEEKWLVPDAMFPQDATYPQVRDKLLNLGPQDRIVDAHPQALPPMSPGSSLDLPPLSPGPVTQTVIITGPGQ